MNSGTLKLGRPEAVGMSYDGLEAAFRVLSREVERGTLPGAVALVARHGAICGLRAYGWAQLYGAKRLMQVDTLFDLASLTKVVATLPSVLGLIERGQMRLDDAVCAFLPEYLGDGREQILIRHLLTHTSGLQAHRRFYEEGLSGRQIIDAVLATAPENPPGQRVVYSDLGFIILGQIVERITGSDISAYATKHVFEPLGMKDTRYLPGEALRDRAAATEYSKKHDKFMIGEVHDENAHELGGIAGHAGLFSTVSDLGVYCQTILNQGTYGGTRVLSRAAVGTSMRLFTPPGEAPRGLGWLKRPPEQCAAGDMLSDQIIYHTGFTGTLLVIDPVNDLFIVLLTNRVHPSRENDSIFRIRPRFCNAVAGSIEDWGQD